MRKPPPGYGFLIDAPFSQPDWLKPEEAVGRHLPIGFTETKVKDMVTWHHPFRLRDDHSFYQSIQRKDARQ